MKRSKIFRKLNRALVSVIFLLMCYPQMTGTAQPDIVKAQQKLILISPAIDSSVIKNEEMTSRNISQAMEISKEVLTKDIPRLNAARAAKAKRVVITKEAEKPTFALRINGEIYEIEPELYRGYLIADVDSILEEVAQEKRISETPLYADTLSKVAVEHAQEQINGWKKFINLFRKKSTK